MITSTNPAPANGQQLRGIDRLITHVRNLEPVRMAVVHPCDALSLGGAMDARDAGIIIPVLVGPQARLQAVAALCSDSGSKKLRVSPHRFCLPLDTAAP